MWLGPEYNDITAKIGKLLFKIDVYKAISLISWNPPKPLQKCPEQNKVAVNPTAASFFPTNTVNITKTK
jgi:hypothetical protein